MSLILSKAAEADMDAIVRAQCLAFHPHESLHILIYPSPDPPTETVIQSNIGKYGGKTLLPRAIVAASKWRVSFDADVKRFQPKIDVNWLPQPSVADEQKFIGKGVADKDYVFWVMDSHNFVRRERMTGPGVLIDILFTHPGWHRKGAGKMMLDWGAKIADQSGLRSWVEASYIGQRLCQRGGFVQLREVIMEGGTERENWSEYERELVIDIWSGSQINSHRGEPTAAG